VCAGPGGSGVGSPIVGLALSLAMAVAVCGSSLADPVRALAQPVASQPMTIPGSPSIEGVHMSVVASNEATLEAMINPKGLDTTYEFWVERGCPTPLPGEVQCMVISVEKAAMGRIAASASAQAVSTTLTDMRPGEYLVYWVVATNSAGSAESTKRPFDESVGWPPEPPPRTETSMRPWIESESASNVTPTDATLEAKINPESLERGVRYQFQVVASTSEYLSRFACPAEGFPANSSLCLGLDKQAGALPIGGIPADMQGQTVSLDLAAPQGWWSGRTTLKPGTTYHYRAIAARSVQTIDTLSWEAPIVYGADRTFTVPDDIILSKEPGGGPLSKEPGNGPGSGTGTGGPESSPSTGSGSPGSQGSSAGDGPKSQSEKDSGATHHHTKHGHIHRHHKRHRRPKTARHRKS
jgi:hypothetical protein